MPQHSGPKLAHPASTSWEESETTNTYETSASNCWTHSSPQIPQVPHRTNVVPPTEHPDDPETGNANTVSPQLSNTSCAARDNPQNQRTVLTSGLDPNYTPPENEEKTATPAASKEQSRWGSASRHPLRPERPRLLPSPAKWAWGIWGVSLINWGSHIIYFV